MAMRELSQAIAYIATAVHGDIAGLHGGADLQIVQTVLSSRQV
jgi:hypothetical protein